jgi:hypothetical protein
MFCEHHAGVLRITIRDGYRIHVVMGGAAFALSADAELRTPARLRIAGK